MLDFIEQVIFFPFSSKSDMKPLKALGQEMIYSDLHFSNVTLTTHWIVDQSYQQDARKHLTHSANCPSFDFILTTFFSD